MLQSACGKAPASILMGGKSSGGGARLLPHLKPTRSMELQMTANASQQGHRVLSGRRIAILATVVGLGTAAMYTDYAFGPQAATNALFAPAYAQNAQRPVGFADIVEKVKPAV